VDLPDSPSDLLAVTSFHRAELRVLHQFAGCDAMVRPNLRWLRMRDGTARVDPGSPAR